MDLLASLDPWVVVRQTISSIGNISSTDSANKDSANKDCATKIAQTKIATKECTTLERACLVPPTCNAIGVVGPMSVAEQGNVSKKGARRA